MIFNVGDSKKIIERAQKLRMEGKIDRAIKTLERSLSGKKNDFPIYLELGKYLFENNKLVESVSNLKRAYHLLPERWEEITEAAESSHFSGGTPVETGTLLIEMYTEKGMFENTRKIIDAHSKEQLKEIESRFETIYDNVISKKASDTYTKRDISHIYVLSMLKQKSNLQDGLLYYEDIFRTFPNESEKILKDIQYLCRTNYGNPHPIFFLGKLLFFNKQYNEGIKYFEKVSELDASFIKKTIAIAETIVQKEKIPVLYLYLAKYELKQGNTKNALSYAHEMENLKDIPHNEISKIYSEIKRKESTNVDVQLSLVRLYTRDGNYDSALSELTNIFESNPEKYDVVTRIAEEIIEKDPLNSNLLYFLSDLYIERGETEKAIVSLEKLFTASKELSGEIIGKLNKALERDLDNTRGLYLLAQAYSYRKRFDDALFIFNHLMETDEGFELAEKGIRKIVEQNPDLVKPKISLGLISFKKGNHKESLDIINSVIETDPSKIARLIPQLDSIARKSEDLAPYVLKVYNEIPAEAIDPFILHFAKAEVLTLSGDYNTAMQQYNSCYDINPDYVDKIIEGLHRIIEQKEDIPEIHFSLGTIYLKADNVTKGLEHIRRAIELDSSLSDKTIKILYKLSKKFPDDPSVEVELLRALMYKGAFEQVIKECEDAVEKYPKSKTGPIYILHGQASLEKGLLKQASLSIVHALDIDETLSHEALKLLKKTLEIDKKNVVVKYALAKASIAAKDYSNAAFYFYDITKYDSKKITKAIEELKKISKYDPVNPDIHFTLGSLYLTEKRLKDAMEEFRATSELSEKYTDKLIGKLHYIEKHTPVPEVHLNLGKLYAKKKMFSKATHHFMKAYHKDSNLAEQSVSFLNKLKELDPRNISILYALAELSEENQDIKNAIEMYERIISQVPEELTKVRNKAKHLAEQHKDKVEPLLFFAKILALEGEAAESIRILKEISNDYPDEIPFVMERLQEMSDRDEREATFALFEYSLSHNQYDNITALLQKIESDFSYHNRMVNQLKLHILQYPEHPELVLYFSHFLFLKDEWQTLKEIISRGLPSLEGTSATRLRLYKHLLLLEEGTDTSSLRNALKKQMGKKEFYSSIKKLRKQKKAFQLQRVQFARKKAPDVPSLLFEEAELHNELGNPDEAIKLLGIRFKSKTDRNFAKILTAKSFFEKNNPVRSIEILRGISLPSDKELKNNMLLLLSSSYEKIGDYKSALIVLKNCEPDANIEKRISYLNEMSVNADIKGGHPIISR